MNVANATPKASLSAKRGCSSCPALIHDLESRAAFSCVASGHFSEPFFQLVQRARRFSLFAGGFVTCALARWVAFPKWCRGAQAAEYLQYIIYMSSDAECLLNKSMVEDCRRQAELWLMPKRVTP